ncbi:ATP-binding protein [Candidatus Protochlamydia amoebophila]|uniref:ATP-binding protein n=1 Tax=Candidatus Protochlamydia amoebophila TaxID=362787 RepID=UPI000A6D2D89|nr:ATP-binding protein [Candidatus Protochlamydia amoebophila]
MAHWKGPFYLKKEGIPKGVYIRLGSTNRPAGPELLDELQRSFLSLSFDQQPLPDLTKDSLNLEKIEQIFASRGKHVNKDKLQSLGILVPYARNLVPSIGGLILFGKINELNHYFPDAKVNCARFIGDNKSNILDRLEIEGTILDAIESVPKFIARNTRLTAQIEGIRRKDITEYPPLAIREVLINALVHNDYSIKGAHIQIAIFDNRLEIQNPGMLPFGFTMEDLKMGVSRVRNRVIARVFHELQLMEAWGSGYRRCVEECKSENYPMPEWIELGAAVRVTFYPHQKTFIKELRKTEQKPLHDLLKRQKAIVALFQPGQQLSFREIFKQLSESIPERTLRYDLAILRDKKLLTSKGKGRAIVWQLIN